MPAFRRAGSKARREITIQAIAQIQQSAGQAAGVLRNTMNDSTVSAHVRLQAARAILDFALKVFEQQEIEQRIADLEKRVKG